MPWIDADACCPWNKAINDFWSDHRRGIDPGVIAAATSLAGLVAELDPTNKHGINTTEGLTFIGSLTPGQDEAILRTLVAAHAGDLDVVFALGDDDDNGAEAAVVLVIPVTAAANADD